MQTFDRGVFLKRAAALGLLATGRPNGCAASTRSSGVTLAVGCEHVLFTTGVVPGADLWERAAYLEHPECTTSPGGIRARSRGAKVRRWRTSLIHSAG